MVVEWSGWCLHYAVKGTLKGTQLGIADQLRKRDTTALYNLNVKLAALPARPRQGHPPQPKAKPDDRLPLEGTAVAMRRI